MATGSAPTGQTTTTTPGMQAAAATIQTTVVNILKNVANVQSSVDTLKSSWSGDASTAFQGSVQPWFDDAKRIVQALSAQADALTDNKNRITAAEADQQQYAQQMASQVAVNF